MIELSHVTKTFGGAKRALDDLTLTVPQEIGRAHV